MADSRRPRPPDELRVSLRPAGAAPASIRPPGNPSRRKRKDARDAKDDAPLSPKELRRKLLKLWPWWLLLFALASPYLINMLTGGSDEKPIADCPGGPPEMPPSMVHQTRCQPVSECYCINVIHCSWRWTCVKADQL